MKIPRLKTEQEVQTFWAAHDASDFWDDMDDDEVQVIVRKSQNIMLLPLDQRTMERARKLAAKRGTSSIRLVRQWIKEGLKREAVSDR